MKITKLHPCIKCKKETEHILCYDEETHAVCLSCHPQSHSIVALTDWVARLVVNKPALMV